MTGARRSSAPSSVTSIRASCRSDGSLDLGATLERCGDLFTRYGGHAGAAGFELPAERWEAFRERFLALAEAAAPPDPRISIAIDLALPAVEVDYDLYRELARLAPCGPGNGDACVAVLGLTVTRVRAASGGHSQLTLRRERDVLDGIAFGRPDIAEVVHEGDRLDVVARLTSRRFGGFESLQLDIRDVASAGEPPRAGLDHRRPRRLDRRRRRREVTRAGAGRPRVPDPYGLLPDRSWLAPGLSVAGLVLVGVLTLNLLGGSIPFISGSGNAGGGGGANRTAAPSNVVVVPQVTFPGSIVYAKAGNIWVQRGR